MTHVVPSSIRHSRLRPDQTGLDSVALSMAHDVVGQTERSVKTSQPYLRPAPAATLQHSSVVSSSQ
jgi:hypothetical protein